MNERFESLINVHFDTVGPDKAVSTLRSDSVMISAEGTDEILRAMRALPTSTVYHLAGNRIFRTVPSILTEQKIASCALFYEPTFDMIVDMFEKQYQHKYPRTFFKKLMIKMVFTNTIGSPMMTWVNLMFADDLRPDHVSMVRDPGAVNRLRNELRLKQLIETVRI